MALLDNTDPDSGFFANLQDPKNYGLLAAGLGILGAANGPNSRGAIGVGALQGLKAAQSAQQNQAIQDYRKVQAAKLTNDIRKQDDVRGLLAGVFGGQEPQGLLPGATAAPIPPDGPAGDTPAPVAHGGLRGVPIEKIAAIKAYGGPDLTDAWKIANFGESVAPGATTVLADGTRISNPSVGQGQVVDFGPGGRPQAIRNLPGAVQAAAQAAGATADATAGANAKYDLVPVPDGKGGTVMMPRSIAASALGGGATGSLGRTQSQSDQTFDTDVAKASADTYNGLQKTAAGADTQIEKLQRIGTLLGDYDGNKFSPTGLELAKFGKSIGLNIADNTGNQEAAQALSNELALSARSTADGGGMPGAMSDADRQFLVSLNPGLTNTADGRKQLIDARVKVLQRSKDVAMAARNWRHKYGRLDTTDGDGNDFQTVLSNWSAANPLFPQGQ